jgi:transposase
MGRSPQKSSGQGVSRLALTDEPWAVLPSSLPTPPRRPDGRGRPGREARAVLSGSLWIWRTGAPWQDVPTRYPPAQTGHRRFQPWVRSGGLEPILRVLATELHERGESERSAWFIDGTFGVATTGGVGWERPRGAKGRSSWPWQPVLVFLSPSTWPVLRRMKSPVLNPRSPRV